MFTPHRPNVWPSRRPPRRRVRHVPHRRLLELGRRAKLPVPRRSTEAQRGAAQHGVDGRAGRARACCIWPRADAESAERRGKVVGAVSHGSEQDLAGALASHAVVALYEGRWRRSNGWWRSTCSSAMAERVARVSRFFFYLRFDTWRSQAGTRVATTPSPTPPAAAVERGDGPHGRRPPRRVFGRLPRLDASPRYGGSVLDFSGRGNRTARDVMDRSWRPGLMDTSHRSLTLNDVSAYSNLGLDLSSSPSGYRFRLPQSSSDPSPPPHLAAQPSVVHEDGSTTARTTRKTPSVGRARGGAAP